MVNLIPLSASFVALFWTAVLNGFLALPLLLIANNRAIMDDRVNGRLLNALGLRNGGWMTLGVCRVEGEAAGFPLRRLKFV